MTLLVVVGSVGLVLSVYLDLLDKYQIDRLFSFFNQNSTNPKLQGLIYTVNNAKSAIGSGGIHGAGLFHGMQTVLGYVPEPVSYTHLDVYKRQGSRSPPAPSRSARTRPSARSSPSSAPFPTCASWSCCPG